MQHYAIQIFDIGVVGTVLHYRLNSQGTVTLLLKVDYSCLSVYNMVGEIAGGMDVIAHIVAWLRGHVATQHLDSLYSERVAAGNRLMVIPFAVSTGAALLYSPGCTGRRR